MAGSKEILEYLLSQYQPNPHAVNENKQVHFDLLLDAENKVLALFKPGKGRIKLKEHYLTLFHCLKKYKKKWKPLSAKAKMQIQQSQNEREDSPSSTSESSSLFTQEELSLLDNFDQNSAPSTSIIRVIK